MARMNGRYALVCGAVLAIAACGKEATSAAFAAFGQGLAQVDCSTTPQMIGGVATNVIKLTVNCPAGSDASACQSLATDEANEAAAQQLATQFCPAFKGLGNVVIQASIAALDTSKATSANTVTVSPASQGSNAKKLSPPNGTVIQKDPWIYAVAVK